MDDRNQILEQLREACSELAKAERERDAAVDYARRLRAAAERVRLTPEPWALRELWAQMMIQPPAAAPPRHFIGGGYRHADEEKS